MIKLRIYSDLHLDHYNLDRLWYPEVLPNEKETTLVLAGDLWIGTRWIEHGGVSWISQVASRFKQVIVVLGNHDYWDVGDSFTIKNGADKCRALLQDMCVFNVHVLDSNIFIDGDYVFVGSTLWTDMNKEDPLSMLNMKNFMRFDGDILFEGNSKFSSQKWVDLHRKQRRFIGIVARNHPDKKIIAVTHHAPLPQMSNSRFNGNAANPYYFSDLSDFIYEHENIVGWICGHSHVTMDEMFFQCCLIMNAVGYQGEHREQAGLVEHRIIDV